MSLYADQPPLRSWTLDVGQGHRLHVDEWGSADGTPALLLHGGPGSGVSPLLRRFFDPARYRVIAPDQRGAGRSRPRGAVSDNDTAHLLADLRLLRETLSLPGWLVVGGSWGATLALAHALDEPQAVSGLLLRSLFLPRQADIDAFFAGGPPLADRAAALHGSDPRAAALDWWRHERARSGAVADEPAGDSLDALVDKYRLQAHYLLHRCWLDDPPLLAHCGSLPLVPMLLLHARDDRVCPPAAAEAVLARCPQARLQCLDRGGHDPAYPGMAAATVAALDRFAAHGDFGP